MTRITRKGNDMKKRTKKKMAKWIAIGIGGCGLLAGILKLIADWIETL